MTTYRPSSSTDTELAISSSRSSTRRLAGLVGVPDPAVLGDPPGAGAVPVRHQRDQAVVLGDRRRSGRSCARGRARPRPRSRPTTIRAVGGADDGRVLCRRGRSTRRRTGPPTAACRCCRCGAAARGCRAGSIESGSMHVQDRAGARCRRAPTIRLLGVEGERGALLDAVPRRVDLGVDAERPRARRTRRSPSRRCASSCCRWPPAAGAAASPGRSARASPACPSYDGVTSSPPPGGIGSLPSGITSTAATRRRSPARTPAAAASSGAAHDARRAPATAGAAASSAHGPTARYAASTPTRHRVRANFTRRPSPSSRTARCRR